MRRILRAAGRTARVFLWVVKGLLLLLAVGAAVMWPVSRGRSMGVTAERSAVGPASGEYRVYSAGCWDGCALLGREWEDAQSGPVLTRICAAIQSGGEGWRWRRRSNSNPWDEGFWPSRRGPLCWNFVAYTHPDWTSHSRLFAAPLWLVSLVAGAWPLASMTLLIRRRRMRRRLALVGCCLHCGYDLRATAEKNGPLLARCPECGADTAAPQRKED